MGVDAGLLRITIFGVGLIGGSLAMCFKGQPGLHVTAYARSESSAQKYRDRNVADDIVYSFEEAALGADIIFVCVPVGMLESYMERLSQLELKTGCIVTDVGSTKSSVYAVANKLQWPDDVYFIGGHPMAGSERSGVEAATTHLFENAYYVLTPDVSVPSAAMDKLRHLLQKTRAHLIQMDPDIHDEVVGAISHLPHIIAAGLVNQVAQYDETNHYYSLLAAGGFRDITRIASSDPIVWRDILLNNRDVLLKLMKDWETEMHRFAAWLEEEDGDQVEEAFQRANAFRSKLPERRKGMLSSNFDVYVDVPDHPGVIGEIATDLGQHQVNLSSIQLLESRVEDPGVLRLSFRNEKDLKHALLRLEHMNYTFHF